MNIVEFLTARLDEDQADAEAAMADAPPTLSSISNHGKWVAAFVPEEMGEATATHIARHDPARVLREVAAKRAIAELHGPDQVDYINADGDSRDSVDCKTCDPGGSPDTWPCDTLKLLAAAYADHPDYDESWRS